jgi:hypothetical protein
MCVPPRVARLIVVIIVLFRCQARTSASRFRLLRCLALTNFFITRALIPKRHGFEGQFPVHHGGGLKLAGIEAERVARDHSECDIAQRK